MAVDEKYVQTVKNDEEYEDILKDLGIEGDFEKSGNGFDLRDYKVTSLREMYHEDECEGKPCLSDIYETSFTDKNTGETTIRYKVDLVLLDDTYEEEKEAYIFPINLNENNIDFDNDTVKDVRSASGLYALAIGLAELKAKGIHNAYNILKIVNIKSLQKRLQEYKTITVQVREKSFKNKVEETIYNSFRIVDAE